ncbi:MAG: biotin--[acetyl-CoA-carboxylase] ligase [Pseudomonadota bacterium]
MRIVHLDTVGSTNDWIAAAAARAEPDGTWVRADRQTEGRGRRGRAWTSEPGNLFASTLVRPQMGEAAPHQLSFIAALALFDMAERYVARERLSLKWPNDLLLDGIKCAGILVEGRGARDQPITIVGIGVNLSHHPDDTERPATSFPAQGIAAPDPAEAAERLAASFAVRRADWRDSGFATIRSAWLARTAHKVGDPLEARLANRTVSGAFAGLGPDGALQLDRDGDITRIDAADVFPAR